jgi:anti-sigma regulatory factor (Ser/Thr protein kinase)
MDAGAGPEAERRPSVPAVIFSDAEGQGLYKGGSILDASEVQLFDETGLPLADDEGMEALVRAGAESAEGVLRYVGGESEGWLRMRAFAISQAEEGPLVVATVCEDVTEERDRAESLQGLRQALRESAHPMHLPFVPGLDLGDAYRPRRDEVGGDFYDVVAREDGSLLLIMGDVSGHGHEVPALASFCRASLRALSLHEGSPAALLADLSEVLRHHHGEGHLITAAVASVRPHDGGAAVCLALDGHPQPRILRADGGVEAVGEPGTLMAALAPGMGEGAQEAALALGPGDALILASDGVMEARDGEGQGLDLEGFLRSQEGIYASVLAGRLERRVSEWAGEGEDVAVLVARVPLPPVLRERFAAEREAIPSARHALMDLRDRYPTVSWEQVALLATELVTNALVHGLEEEGISGEGAWMELCVEERAGRRLRFSITTPGPQFDAFSSLRVSDSSDPSGRGLFLVDSLASRWGMGDDGGCCVWFECDLG